MNAPTNEPSSPKTRDGAVLEQRTRMRAKVIGVVLLVVVLGGGALFGYIRARSETDSLHVRLQRLHQSFSTTTIPSWSTPSQGLVLPTAHEAREWLTRYGKADLQRSADDPFLDALAANTVVSATDLEEDDAHRILDWLYVRAVRDRTQCLRRWTELVRFAEAYRISTSSLLNYWGAAEPMMLCAAESSNDDRDHAADIFEALGTRPSRWHRILQLYPPYDATEGLREDVRPWSLLDSEFRHRIEDVRREIDVAERALLEPGDSWDLLSLHIEELREHEWPRSAPRFYLRHDRFAALHPPRLEPRARIAEEAAQQAEHLILRTLAEEGALYDALRGEP